MINTHLIDPKSIAVIGASNDVRKPGGKLLRNLIDTNYKGHIYAVNPNENSVQGIETYSNLDDLPQVDLAVLAIAAKYCLASVRNLIQKGVKAFIIISAGFGEESLAGKELEMQIADMVSQAGACLIGPNCIGVMNPNHASVFTTPIPKFNVHACDFISASGATAVFIIDLAISKGIQFNSIFSVGNCAQLGAEEILEYLDETFDLNTSARVKLLYLESIRYPEKLLRHAASLIAKGCQIAAIKAGSSDAGVKAAASHTGALANSDVAVDALFRKAGIVRCYGRDELTDVASIMLNKKLTGNRLAIVTHAGGPAVMLTDALSSSGMEIPRLGEFYSRQLLEKLHHGSSVANPIDFLATGTAEQLDVILEYCESKFDNIDGTAVIFGSPGLSSVSDAYECLNKRIKTSLKPIYSILPSSTMVKAEVESFLNQGNTRFFDEVNFGKALAKVFQVKSYSRERISFNDLDHQRIRKIIDSSPSGFLSQKQNYELLNAVGIKQVQEIQVHSYREAECAIASIGFPVAMKVVGPLHKTEVAGVVLGVCDMDTVIKEYDRLMTIDGAVAVLIQPMVDGTELFIGVKYEPSFGHLVLWGMGGVLVEVFNDVRTGLAPLDRVDVADQVKKMKGIAILNGIRGKAPVNIGLYIDSILRIGALVEIAPEIVELDLNPLKGTSEKMISIDSRICIAKSVFEK